MKSSALSMYIRQENGTLYIYILPSDEAKLSSKGSDNGANICRWNFHGIIKYFKNCEPNVHSFFVVVVVGGDPNLPGPPECNNREDLCPAGKP